MLEGEDEESAVTGEFEFLANVAAMGFDGAVTDEEFAGDLLVGLVLSDKAQDAAFSRCERTQSFLLFLQGRGALVASHQKLRDRRADEYATGGDGFQAREHVADGVFLEHVPLRAGIHRGVERAFVRLHREHDDDGRMRQRAHRADHFQAADLRQIEIQHRNVRLDRLDLLNGAFAVAQLRGDKVLRVRLDDFSQAAPKDRMVVDYYDAGFILHGDQDYD